jgi:hypothetical protein
MGVVSDKINDENKIGLDVRACFPILARGTHQRWKMQITSFVVPVWIGLIIHALCDHRTSMVLQPIKHP